LIEETPGLNVSAEPLKYYGPRQLVQVSMRLKKTKKKLFFLS